MAAKKSTYLEPVIIVGAPRSGTKMLRELLRLHPEMIGPQYELERVWCHGNRHRLNREITTTQLTPGIERYIRKYFVRLSRRNGGKRIIDKCVANSLRLNFVRTVFPSSPIIHIIRDGRDASCSILKRWRNPADLRYILKNRIFPWRELPFFIARQIRWYANKLFSRQGHVKTWGPQFDDWREVVNNHDVIEVCGIQWKRCLEAILISKTSIPDSLYLEVRYEDIVQYPVRELRRILNFLGLETPVSVSEKASTFVNDTSIGRWRKSLTEEEYAALMKHIQPLLKDLGYI